MMIAVLVLRSKFECFAGAVATAASIITDFATSSVPASLVAATFHSLIVTIDPTIIEFIITGPFAAIVTVVLVPVVMIIRISTIVSIVTTIGSVIFILVLLLWAITFVPIVLSIIIEELTAIAVETIIVRSVDIV